MGTPSNDLNQAPHPISMQINDLEFDSDRDQILVPNNDLDIHPRPHQKLTQNQNPSYFAGEHLISNDDVNPYETSESTTKGKNRKKKESKKEKRKREQNNQNMTNNANLYSGIDYQESGKKGKKKKSKEDRRKRDEGDLDLMKNDYSANVDLEPGASTAEPIGKEKKWNKKKSKKDM